MTSFQTKRGSSSRLSPLARPFTIKRSNSTLSHWPQRYSCLAATVLPRSFSDFTCEGYSITPTPYHDRFDASPSFQYADHSSIIAPNTYYSQYPSPDFQLPVYSKSALNGMPINGTIPPGHTVHKNVTAENQEERIDHRWNDKDAVVSISYDISSKQGTELLKQCGETSDHLCEKWIEISQKDNKIISEDANFVSFPTTSESCSIPMLNCPQTKLKVSCSSESNSSAVDVAGSSGPSTGYLPLDLLSLYNLDSGGCNSLSYNNPFIGNPVSVKEPETPLDTNDKEVSHQILIDGSKDGKTGKLIIDEIMDSLDVPKSEIQMTNDGVPHDLMVKSPSAGESEPVENSSKMLGDNDSDLDSPCWKGKLAANKNSFGDSGPVNSQLKSSICPKGTFTANQKTFADSGSVNSHLKTGQELLCSLNPLASHWFSSNDKQSINCYRNECGGVDSLFSLETASSAVNLLSKDQRLADSVSAGSSSSDLRNIFGIHCSSDIHNLDKEDSLKNSSSSSLLSFSGMLQPSHLENHCKSNVQLKAGPNVAVSVRGTEDDLHHALTSFFVPSKSFCSSSSCRAGVPSDCTETHGGETRSFSRPPRLDIQKMVVTMNKLSELLMQNCSNDLHSLNEHERDIIKHIINNLNMCLGNRIQERTLMPESSHPYASFCLRN